MLIFRPTSAFWGAFCLRRRWFDLDFAGASNVAVSFPLLLSKASVLVVNWKVAVAVALLRDCLPCYCQPQTDTSIDADKAGECEASVPSGFGGGGEGGGGGGVQGGGGGGGEDVEGGGASLGGGGIHP